MALIASDGRILEANRLLCRMLGFSRNALRALNVSDITHADDLDTEREQRRRLAVADIGRYELTQRYVRKDRVAIWVQLSVSGTRRRLSDAQCLVLHAESIPAPTGNHASDQQDERVARLRKATMSAVHEIANCLTPLMLNTEMILEQSRRSEISDSAHQIIKAARRIAFTLGRLRGIHDVQPVAYVGQNSVLDLRILVPPAETKSTDS